MTVFGVHGQLALNHVEKEFSFAIEIVLILSHVLTLIFKVENAIFADVSFQLHFVTFDSLLVGLGDWTAWSSCSECCGEWTSSRSRTCTDGQCTEKLIETKGVTSYPNCE